MTFDRRLLLLLLLLFVLVSDGRSRPKQYMFVIIDRCIILWLRSYVTFLFLMVDFGCSTVRSCFVCLVRANFYFMEIERWILCFYHQTI